MRRSRYNRNSSFSFPKIFNPFKLISRKSRGRRKDLAVSALMGLTVMVIFGFIMFGILVLIFARDLPSPTNLQRKSGFSTTFVDRNGEVLYELYKDKNLVPVGIDKIPLPLQQAIVAIEDKNFYKHSGFSIQGILRGAFSTIFRQRVQGGSTITQQLVKNALLSQQRSLIRKLKEFVLSIEIERRYTKKQILEMYLNESPFGGSYWGVGTAARGYFGKDVSQLSLMESAILAGLPQSPTRYSPCNGKSEAYKGRTENVLRRMREDGYIDKNTEKSTLEQLKAFKIEKCNIAISAPHFVFYVRDQIADKFGEEIFRQGVTIKTTLDSKIQQKVQEITYNEIEKVKKLKATNGAVVVMDVKTSEILAMVGSYDFFDEEYGEYNTAMALRQPGSAVKPITYAVGLSSGYTPATVFMDVPTSFRPEGATEDYNPVNYDGKYRGPVQLRFALGNSLNIPAVKMLSMIGIKNFLSKANEMGLTQFEPTEKNMKRFGLAITLGGGETRLFDMTNAFSVFARNGKTQSPIYLKEIKDYSGRSLFEQEKSNPSKQVLSPQVTYLISHILSDDNARSDAFGTGSLLNIKGKTVAVKTGTTNDKRDNWAVGYTTDIVAGVWVGNNDNSPMNPAIASGTTGASSIWNAVMRELLTTFDYKDGIGPIPEGVEAIEIDSLMGGLPHSGQASRSEYFIKDTLPSSEAPNYKRLKISKSDGSKMASSDEISGGNYEEKDFVVLTEIDPVSKDGKNRFQEGIDAWIASQDNLIYKVPSGVSSSSGQSNGPIDWTISLNSPSNESTIEGDKVVLSAHINGGNIQNVKIFIDGVEKWSVDGNNHDIKEEYHLQKGTYEIKLTARDDKNVTKEVIAKTTLK